jgi:hypothetical protein
VFKERDDSKPKPRQSAHHRPEKFDSPGRLAISLGPRPHRLELDSLGTKYDRLTDDHSAVLGTDVAPHHPHSNWRHSRHDNKTASDGVRGDDGCRSVA